MAPLDDLLACPRCDAPLSRSDDGYGCKACQARFVYLDGIPFLFAEPAYARDEWRARGHAALAALQSDADHIGFELAGPSLLPETRQRLQLLRDAYRSQRERLATLLTPLLANASPASPASYLALRTRLPADQGLNTYFQNIHRDWAWGDDENRQSVELVASVIDGTPDKVLILGAGAGRLAYDLHQRFDNPLTAALDFNPLLMLLAAKVSRGKSVELYEFPLAPRNLKNVAVLRELSAPPARTGLHWLLADVQRPPFAAGAFDLVVTPWLADILPTDFSRLAANVNRLLKNGGQWINFGSLAFAHRQISLCYSIEELPALYDTAKFSAPSVTEATIPYMCSPASRHGRREQVLSIAAAKTGEAPAPPRHTALPDWAVTGTEPVPLTRDFQMQAAATRIHSYVMGLIDGQRSIRDMAVLMEQQKLMSRDEAEASIRAMLIKMHDDAQ